MTEQTGTIDVGRFYCWKQGRFTNIFETKITYFTQFVHIHS